MTITVSSNKVTFLGNGATTVFAYSFAMPAGSDRLYFTDATGAQTLIASQNYTITGVGQPTYGGGPQGGTVTYPLSGSPIPVGTSLTLLRMVADTQPNSFVNQGGLWPQVVEQSDDNLEMQIQQIAEIVSRALVVSVSELGPEPPLPPAAIRAGKYLTFDQNGNPTVGQPIGNATVSAAMIPVIAAATTQVALSLLGATPALVNIAALLAATSASLPGSICFVEGYYAAGDRGGGVYTIGATTTANGGTIVNDASGRSWYLDLAGQVGVTVLQFGAKGDSATNDQPAIQRAINWCLASGRGPLNFPATGGTYKCASGLAVNGNGLRLVGAGTLLTLVQATTPTFNLLTINGFLNTIENMWWDIPGFPSAVSAVSFTTCVQCKIIDCNITGGFIPLQFAGAGADNMIFRTRVGNSYGPSQIFLGSSSGQYFYRTQVDQPWPAGKPGNSNILGAWTANTPVTGVCVMTLGGFNIQCVGGGTTGAVAPTLATFGVNFTDGGVTWQLAGSASLVGVQMDTGSDANFFLNCDFTGAYVDSILFSNSAAGFGPQKTWIKDSEFGEFLSAGINAGSGAGLLVEGCTFDNGVQTGCAGVSLSGSWSGDVSIEGCLVTGGVTFGFLVGAGTNTVLSGNQIYGCSGTAIFVASNINQFTITGNQCGQSGTWGTNAHAITVASGTSNFYIINGNNTAGASVSISDGGSGGSKSVANNI